MYKEKKCNHQITTKNKEFGTVKCVCCGYAWDSEKQAKKQYKQYVCKKANQINKAKLQK